MFLRRPFLSLLILGLTLTLRGGPAVQATVEIITPIPELPVTKQPSIDFYDARIDPYTYTGPLLQMPIGPDCQVNVTGVPRLRSSAWQAQVSDDTPAKQLGTVIFFDRVQAIQQGCYSSTQVMKQIPAALPTISARGYPAVKVALFACVLLANTTFGGLDTEVIDDYFYHLPPGVEVAQIGLDTGVMFSQLTQGAVNVSIAAGPEVPYVPIVVRVTEDPGWWNRMLQSAPFRGYLIFSYISFAPCIAYAIYEFARLLIASKCRFQPRFFIFLAALFYLVVSMLLAPTAPLSRVQNVFRYLSWVVGYFTLFTVLLMWLRIMQRIMERTLARVIAYTIYLDMVVVFFANSVLIYWSITINPTALLIGYSTVSMVASAILYLLGLFLVPYGVMVVRNVRRMNIPEDTRIALLRLATLSAFGFTGMALFTVASILSVTSVTQYTSACIVRSVMFQSGSLIVFTSTFWVLRVRESSPLRRRHLMLVSGCDDHNGTHSSSGGTYPMNYIPKISEPTAYFANDRVFLWHRIFNRGKHTAGTWWKRALSCGRNPSAARAADSHHALRHVRQSQADEAAANSRIGDFEVFPLENNYFSRRCCPTHGNPHCGGKEGDGLSTTTLGSSITKSCSKLDEAYPNPPAHFSTGVHLPAQTHSSSAAGKPSSNQTSSA